MIEKIYTEKVVLARMGNICLSKREETVKVKIFPSERMFGVNDLHDQLRDPHQDVVMLIGRDDLPLDIRITIRQADQIEQRQDRRHDFIQDWEKYCKYIGLTTFHGVCEQGKIEYKAGGVVFIDPRRRIKEEVSISYEEYFPVFGELIPEMDSVTIFLTTRTSDDRELTALQFFPVIAHELGHISFLHQVLPSNNIDKFSNAGAEFFANAYAYEALLTFIAGNRDDNRKIGLMIGYLEKFFTMMRGNYSQLGAEEKKYFEVFGPEPSKMEIGKRLIVKLA